MSQSQAFCELLAKSFLCKKVFFFRKHYETICIAYFFKKPTFIRKRSYNLCEQYTDSRHFKNHFQSTSILCYIESLSHDKVPLCAHKLLSLRIELLIRSAITTIS